MKSFQQTFWGYELEIPDDWVHRPLEDADGFAATSEALELGYEGSNLGHILVRGEWNWQRQPIEPIWKQHMTRLSIMLGAKKVGSAPWTMGGGLGLEAVIQLPKKVDNRLWTGILAFRDIVLHFMVTHKKDERQWFEPLATQVLSSLRFINKADHLDLNENGLPLPPGYTPTDPKSILADLSDLEPWQAFEGNASPGALQAFYTREAPAHGWKLQEYVPYPEPSSGLGFARYKFHKSGKTYTLGIFPFGEKNPVGKVVIKDENRVKKC
jgi:hypothetical protein